MSYITVGWTRDYNSCWEAVIQGANMMCSQDDYVSTSYANKPCLHLAFYFNVGSY